MFLGATMRLRVAWEEATIGGCRPLPREWL